MKEIIWKGPDRIIPDCGIAEYGKTITVEDADAASFVEQGLAEFPRGKAKSTVKEPDDE